MNNPPNQLQQNVIKTAHAALRWSAAAFMAHFQSQRRTPLLAGTVCASHQLLANGTPLFERYPVSRYLIDEAIQSEPVASGSMLLQDITQEMIRLNSRITKSLIDCVHSVLYRRNIIHPKRSANLWIIQFCGRLQTDTSLAKIQSMPGTSVSSVTDEEYNIRRDTRQRVFHEKGNAD